MKTKTIKLYHLTIFSTLVLAMLGALIFSSISTPKSSALDGSDFDPGRIIDDAVFKNEKSMSVSQIQQFLNSKMPDCDTDGSEPYAGTTRAAYGASRGYPAPYTCLRDYTQTVPATSSSSSYCTSSMTGGTKTAAQIIHDVGHACDINPQVLIVMLQKEQGLVTDEWPWSIQYRSAMGYGCPDTAPCDEEYYGFFNQVYQGANAYLRYAANPSWYSYRAGRTNTIYWHPDLSRCGSSNVFIENQSTAGLYIYTPYRPNSSALNNLYTTGNSCSSYGNRNFWRYFNDWFGSTMSTAVFKDMSYPRWMQLKEDTRKLVPHTFDEVGSTLPQGKQIFFTDKITINNKTYLRTEYDSERWENKIIPIEVLEDVPINFSTTSTPRWIETTADSYKVDPISKTYVGKQIKSGTKLFINTQVEVGGSTYYRTFSDNANGVRAGLLSDDITDSSLNYTAFTQPRWLVVTEDTRVYDIRYPGISVNQPIILAGSKMYLDYKVLLNGRWYATNDMPGSGEYIGTPLDHLRNVQGTDFVNMENQRAYKLIANTEKVELANGQNVEPLMKDQVIYFTHKISLNGELFLRSSYDSTRLKSTAIPLSLLNPVDVTFEAMDNPRSFRLNRDLKKVDPVTLRDIGPTLPRDQNINFSQRIRIDGKLYLRTEYDSMHGHYKVIPINLLSET